MTSFREYEEDGIRQWADQIQNGDNRMIARAISCLESGDSRGEALLEELYPRTGRAFLVGLTGAPGSR